MKPKKAYNENDNDTAILAAAGLASAEPEAAAEKQETLTWLADRCQAVTDITPNRALRKRLGTGIRPTDKRSQSRPRQESSPMESARQQTALADTAWMEDEKSA